MEYDVRLPGHGGAAVFFQTAILPGLPPHPGLDISFLTPGRFVSYTGRAMAPDFLDELATFCFRAAADEYPDQSLATLTDERLGLTVSVRSSDPTRVTLLFKIVDNPEEPGGFDGLEFDTSRVALATAAESVGALVGRTSFADLDGGW